MLLTFVQKPLIFDISALSEGYQGLILSCDYELIMKNVLKIQKFQALLFLKCFQLFKPYFLVNCALINKAICNLSIEERNNVLFANTVSFSKQRF